MRRAAFGNSSLLQPVQMLTSASGADTPPLPVKLRPAPSRQPGAILRPRSRGATSGGAASLVAHIHPLRSRPRRGVCGVPHSRALGAPSRPHPGRGGGPFPGGSHWGGTLRHPRRVGDARGWGWAGIFWEEAAWVPQFKCRVPLACSRRRRWRERGSPGTRGRTGPTFSSSLPAPPAAARGCRKRRRVLTCALLLSAPRPRWGANRGPLKALAPTLPVPARGRGAESRPAALSLRLSPRCPLPCKLRWAFFPIAQFNITYP